MKLTVCSDHKTCHTGGWDTGIDESEMPSTALRPTAMGLHNRRKTIFHLHNNKEYIWRFCCQVIYLSSQTRLCSSGVATRCCLAFLLKLIFTPKLCVWSKSSSMYFFYSWIMLAWTRSYGKMLNVELGKACLERDIFLFFKRIIQLKTWVKVTAFKSGSELHIRD